MENEEPYIKETRIEIITEHKYNPKYGNDRICECGHPYHRHFDPYEKWDAVGCKYCDCMNFKEKSKN